MQHRINAGPATCGHSHTASFYELGCSYAHQLALAFHAAALTNPRDTAVQHHAAADTALWPLGDITDPEDLRDFIAGTHHYFELHLGELGVAIQC